MKILYCLLGTYNSSGMERIVVAKANALASRGHEVIIVTTEQNARPDFYALHPSVHRFDSNVMYSEAKSLSPLRKYIVRRNKIRCHKNYVRQIIDTYSPDVVISTFGNEVSFLHRIAGKAATVAEIHFSRYYRLQLKRKGPWRIIDRFLTLTDRLTVRHYDRFVVLTRSDASNWGPLRSLTVIPNFVTGIAAQQTDLQHKRMIAVGRLEPQKNYPRMIEVWEHVCKRHPHWTLEIYGDGSELENLRALVKKKNLTENIKFMGVAHDMTAVYSRASALIHTASYEGFPLVLIEAMTVGLPLIAFDCQCGPSDVIDHGINGFLIPQGDTAAMTEAITRLITDPALRRRMGEASFAKARNYSMYNILPQWETLLSSINEKH